MGIIFLFIGDPISVSQCSYGNLTTRYYGTFQMKKIYRDHDNFSIFMEQERPVKFCSKEFAQNDTVLISQ